MLLTNLNIKSEKQFNTLVKTFGFDIIMDGLSYPPSFEAPKYLQKHSKEIIQFLLKGDNHKKFKHFQRIEFSKEELILLIETLQRERSLNWHLTINDDIAKYVLDSVEGDISKVDDSLLQLFKDQYCLSVASTKYNEYVLRMLGFVKIVDGVDIPKKYNIRDYKIYVDRYSQPFCAANDKKQYLNCPINSTSFLYVLEHNKDMFLKSLGELLLDIRASQRLKIESLIGKYIVERTSWRMVQKVNSYRIVNNKAILTLNSCSKNGSPIKMLKRCTTIPLNDSFDRIINQWDVYNSFEEIPK